MAYVYTRTDGNALFMVNIVEHLVQQGGVVRQAGQWTLREGTEAPVQSLPAGLQALLLRRIEALAPEARRVLETASVVGEEFAVAAVAAGAQGTVEAVEAQCEAVAAQRHFLDDIGVAVWPYGTRAGEIAAPLAVHFERGGEIQRAVHYWQQTGDNAGRRHAYPEALAALRKGLALLATLPESPERVQRELTLQLSLGELLIVAKGAPAPEVGEVYGRAHHLCHQLGETPQQFQTLQGLQRFHLVQAQLHTADELAQQLIHLAHRQGEAGRVQEAQAALGAVAFFRGDFMAARAHLEHGPCHSDTPPPSALTFHGGHDYLRVTHLGWMMQILWELGY